MKIREIVAAVDGRLVCVGQDPDAEVEKAFASDLMSDVLTLSESNLLLITGLANIQSVRAVEMSDIHCLLLCRGKKAGEDMIELARENGLTLIESRLSVFYCCARLFNAALTPV